MTRTSIPNPVLWRVTTGTHDWGTGKYLTQLFSLWREAGLVGLPEWATGQDEKLLRIAPDKDIVATMLAQPQRRGALSAIVGGSEPHPWQTSLVLSRFDPDLRRNEGYNIVNLEVPRAVCMALSTPRLLDLFEQAHGPDDTEFAGLHPKTHWTHLQADVFVPALTIGPMFAGLYWADFLGPGTIELFPRKAINGLDVARRRWHGRRGVSLAVTDDLATSDIPETERRLAAMTNALRGAMKAT